LIEAVDLERRFGAVRAVDRMSFRVMPGCVTGFLGPNGAGKTTTLRMLATYLVPTGGTARVGGADLRTDPAAVRRRVGYLCEGAPLPGDLRVGEYLEIRGGMRGLGGASLRGAVGTALERFDLAGVERRLIGRLSKGFRQRVGLADALLADPPVLLLDEPTSALDPDQVRRVREVLRDLSTERAVFVSTHLLAEAESLCGALVVVHRGRVAASGTPEAIVSAHGSAGDRAVAARPGARCGPDVPVSVSEAAGGAVPASSGDGVLRWSLVDGGDGDPAPRLVAALAAAGWEVIEVSRSRATLERVFLSLTGGGGGAA
jgi:ABC-2 type transport system ATP-binding protein